MRLKLLATATRGRARHARFHRLSAPSATARRSASRRALDVASCPSASAPGARASARWRRRARIRRPANRRIRRRRIRCADPLFAADDAALHAARRLRACGRLAARSDARAAPMRSRHAARAGRRRFLPRRSPPSRPAISPRRRRRVGGCRRRLADTAARWAGPASCIRTKPASSASRPSSRRIPTGPPADWLRRRARGGACRRASPRQGREGAGSRTTKPHDRLTANMRWRRRWRATAISKSAAALSARRLARGRPRPELRDASFDKELGELLTPADHKYRADRLLYAGKNGPAPARRRSRRQGCRACSPARARRRPIMASAATGSSPPCRLAAERSRPALLAHPRCSTTPRNTPKPARCCARRRPIPRRSSTATPGGRSGAQTSRKLLDTGDAETAYLVARSTAPQSTSNKVEAEFQAGWIALRFLDDPIARLAPFRVAGAGRRDAAAEVARALLARSRGGGLRTPEDDAKAREFYRQAATHSTTFYGQLASAKLGARRRARCALPRRPREDHERARGGARRRAAARRPATRTSPRRSRSTRRSIWRTTQADRGARRSHRAPARREALAHLRQGRLLSRHSRSTTSPSPPMAFRISTRFRTPRRVRSSTPLRDRKAPSIRKRFPPPAPWA